MERKFPKGVQNGVTHPSWGVGRVGRPNPKEKMMPKFLCMQRTLNTGEGGGEKPSPAQMQEMYAQFGAWMEKFKDNLVDPGGKLGTGKLVSHPNQADGPFVEVKELVGGYMIVEADDIEGAMEVARQCPGLVRPGSGCEVIEIHTP
jgi:hypothetical protein